ncbi:hypothetical protein A2V71_00045 [Candidatus Berkelbacteria bacterium RBG_13_40_8]|uniref:Uncharacterized protein n=1 Tax=Candidatus Berkelbacteria bacterium RBG_13_40_8 TaxID=1797467 RepID=A0A1F5DLE8_9BACT|nr:MAG: hypothetical protein A2V71_00045 [Candidatus Berkelbacteria bacterium RBG_13_40_8]
MTNEPGRLWSTEFKGVLQFDNVSDGIKRKIVSLCHNKDLLDEFETLCREKSLEIDKIPEGIMEYVYSIRTRWDGDRLRYELLYLIITESVELQDFFNQFIQEKGYSKEINPGFSKLMCYAVDHKAIKYCLPEELERIKKEMLVEAEKRVNKIFENTQEAKPGLKAHDLMGLIRQSPIFSE